MRSSHPGKLSSNTFWQTLSVSRRLKDRPGLCVQLTSRCCTKVIGGAAFENLGFGLAIGLGFATVCFPMATLAKETARSCQRLATPEPNYIISSKHKRLTARYQARIFDNNEDMTARVSALIYKNKGTMAILQEASSTKWKMDTRMRAQTVLPIDGGV